MQQKMAVCPEKLREITGVYPTPFHLYDEHTLRRTARRLQNAFSWNTGFREYFAVKANPNPYILDIFRQEGCGADCASEAELMLAESVGFSGDQIMFSSNMTHGKEYEYARRLGAIINLDDITHIDFLAKHGGIPEKICLRFNPGGKLQLGNLVMGDPGDAKYGMTRAQIFEAVEKLQSLGTKKFAFHAFLASNTTNSSYYPTLAKILFDLAVEVREKLGAEIFMVNLSGGVGIPYEPGQEPADIAWIGEEIRRLYSETLVPAGLGNISLSSELGRYMSGPGGCLVATAIHEKHIYKEYIGLDACAADLMRPAMYGAYHHITIPGKENMPCDHVYDVVGSLCENNDKFAIDRALPKIDMGDLVVIHDTGAHGHSMGYNYNGKLRSAEILLHEDGSFEQIRRPERAADYFATLDNTVFWERLAKIVKETEV